jgi:hypothetical protein
MAAQNKKKNIYLLKIARESTELIHTTAKQVLAVLVPIPFILLCVHETPTNALISSKVLFPYLFAPTCFDIIYAIFSSGVPRNFFV